MNYPEDNGNETPRRKILRVTKNIDEQDFENFESRAFSLCYLPIKLRSENASRRKKFSLLSIKYNIVK